MTLNNEWINLRERKEKKPNYMNISISLNYFLRYPV